jgi:hypothetical protein
MTAGAVVLGSQHHPSPEELGLRLLGVKVAIRFRPFVQASP